MSAPPAGQSPGIVAVTKEHRNSSYDGKQIVKFTDKTMHYAGGITKKTMLIKRTPVDELAVPAEPQQETLDDGTVVTKHYRTEMCDKYITKHVDCIIQHPDGTIKKRSSLYQRWALKDLFGYDFTDFKDPEDNPGESQQVA